MNEIRDAADNLAFFDHRPLLEAILRHVRQSHLYSAHNQPEAGKPQTGRDSLQLNTHAIAKSIAERSRLDDPVRRGAGTPTCVTVNYAPDTEQRVTAVLNALAQEIDAQFRRVADAAGQSAETYAATLLTDRGQITGPARRLGFTYPFDRTVYLKRQRLTFKAPPRTAGATRTAPILRSHHLTVTVRLPDDVVIQVRDSLREYIALICPDDEDRVALVEMLDRMVEEPGSDLHRLIRIITAETLGQIKKLACRRYLGYLADRMSAEKAKTIDAQRYVRDLIHRLEAIEIYIHDNRPDDAYQFSYRGDEYDWRSILSGATLYEELPLVAQVGESLGETMDDRHGQEQTFSYGLRLKLNGPALAVGAASAFAYRKQLLADPATLAEQGGFKKERLLRLLFLYHVVFSRFGEQPPDPLDIFLTQVMPVLKAGDDAAKDRLFRGLANRLGRTTDQQGHAITSIEQKVTNMATALRDVLKRDGALEPQTWAAQINVLQGILEHDVRSMRFDRQSVFRDVFTDGSRQALRYITITTPGLQDHTVCSFSVAVTVHDVRSYAVADDVQSFTMAYDPSVYKFLLALIQPGDDVSGATYATALNRYKAVLIRCDPALMYARGSKPEQWFIYRYVVTLLAYLGLHTIMRYAGADTFIPILRLHNTPEDAAQKNGDGDFLKMLSKLLAHMLSIDYLSNAQGYFVGQSSAPDRFRVPNALSSLNSVLPKVFSPVDGAQGTDYTPTLDKLALVVVSSRQSDAVRDGAYKKSTIYGEIVTIDQHGDGSVTARRRQTFAGNYDSETLHRNPTALIDAVHAVVESGYTHIAYIARSPFTSTLHLTQREARESLYFMSPDILDAFRGDRDDLHIYPLFCSEYDAVKIHPPAVDSLYIQDPLEQQQIVRDAGRHIVVFASLYNGKSVRHDTTYNGVVTYGTLVNMYDDLRYNQSIWAMLNDEGRIKSDLVYYLTLFHASRYEASQTDIALKLDPYAVIIGDDSVGPLAERQSYNTRYTFDFLSWLTEVRTSVLDAQGQQEQRGGAAAR